MLMALLLLPLGGGDVFDRSMLDADWAGWGFLWLCVFGEKQDWEWRKGTKVDRTVRETRR